SRTWSAPTNRERPQRNWSSPLCRRGFRLRKSLQARTNFLNDRVRGGRACCQADDTCAGKPLRAQLFGVGHLESLPAEAAGQLGEFAAVVAVGAADHDNHGALSGQLLQRLLSFLGRLADGINKTHVGPWKTPADGSDQV